LRQYLRFTSVRRTDISSDRSWKIGRHVFFGFCFSRKQGNLSRDRDVRHRAKD
jgi:hypothetical protein